MSLESMVEKAASLDSIFLNIHSQQSALLSAGSVVECVRLVAEGSLDCAAAVVRPPGHHAESHTAMGFCLYNNVAVAAKAAVEQFGLQRVLIVDWDGELGAHPALPVMQRRSHFGVVPHIHLHCSLAHSSTRAAVPPPPFSCSVHHGNGTQNMFAEDPRIMYFSVHMYQNARFYPFSPDAAPGQVGKGPGEGFTVNVAWNKPGMADGDYVAVWNQVLMPIAYEFNPQLVSSECTGVICLGSGGVKSLLLCPLAHGHPIDTIPLPPVAPNAGHHQRWLRRLRRRPPGAV